ncbi:MAG: hypothetical protein LBD35_06100 [Prevotellaceae bacterium]|jgi:hypothetical protein|nr:hypothetical protein [Prevotellaceae bacterium]
MEPLLSTDDLRALFEDDHGYLTKKYKTQLDLYFDKYDFEELAEYEDDERTVAFFETLFMTQIVENDDFMLVIEDFGEKLPFEFELQASDNGKLEVAFNGRTSEIPRDGYKALRAFNTILAPDYEIRALRTSVEDETGVHSLLLLDCASWQTAEKDYGNKVAEYFVTLNNADF